MIPVIWATNNAESIARGYWDQGFIEELLSGAVWRVPGALDFEHHEVRGGTFPALDGSGAVVIVPGRHNAERKHVIWLNAQLATLPWALLIFTGDEAAEFPWQKIEHPHCRIWAMGARSMARENVDQPLGSGYPPGMTETMREPLTAGQATRRSLNWCFAGQITHERREQCAAALRSLPEGTGYFLGTPGFTQGIDQHTYWGILADAKVAPCPSGPESPDSFRLYEALEAGCIPIADAATPHGPEASFWTYIFGEPPPFPEVSSWEALPALMDELLAGWPANANRVFAWWQAWKRRLAWELQETIHGLSGLGAPRLTAPDEQITVIVPTSPAALHPSTEHIEETIASIRERLPLAEVIIVADGVRPEQEDRHADYDEYLRRLLWLCAHEWENVLPVLMPEWGHQANCTRAALNEVRTALVLFVEHDTPLFGETPPWAELTRTIHLGVANVIRLHHEGTINPEHRHLMLDPTPTTTPLGASIGVPLIRTVQWSQRPHLAPTWFYRDLIDRYFAPESRTMIEDALHGVVQNDWNVHGSPGWERWRLWLYAPDGDMRRSGHLDSRAGAPKYEMTYAYTGPTPEGAPRPGRRA